MSRFHHPAHTYEHWHLWCASLFVGIALVGSPHIATADESACTTQLQTCMSAKKGIAHQCVMDGVVRLDKAVQPVFRDAYLRCRTEGERPMICVEATIESINEDGKHAPIDPSHFTPCWDTAKSDLQSCQAAYSFCRGG